MNNDRSTVQIVVIGLILIALGALGCGTYLLGLGKQEASVAVIFTLAGAAVGGLSSILAHTGSGVVQVQPATALVPVADKPPPDPVAQPPAEVAA